MSDDTEVLELEKLLERLQGRFPDVHREGIETLVAQVHHQYDASSVRAFIPVLVEREVSEKLRVPRPRRSQDQAAAAV